MAKTTLTLTEVARITRQRAEHDETLTKWDIMVREKADHYVSEIGNEFVASQMRLVLEYLFTNLSETRASERDREECASGWRAEAENNEDKIRSLESENASLRRVVEALGISDRLLDVASQSVDPARALKLYA
jgi:hypothetical protein